MVAIDMGTKRMGRTRPISQQLKNGKNGRLPAHEYRLSTSDAVNFQCDGFDPEKGMSSAISDAPELRQEINICYTLAKRSRNVDSTLSKRCHIKR